MDAITKVPAPVNEPPRSYTDGSAERAALEPALKEIWGTRLEITNWIDGQPVAGGGDSFDVVAPFDKSHVLGTFKAATADDTAAAIAAAKKAAPAWAALSIDDRAAVLLKAADLLTGSWRAVTNAATMLSQAKTIYQAEIDAVCELADFWRFNAHFARQIYAEQPAANSPGIWNRLDHRPLEGFVYAITPFNFTSIAANLATAPALMGNTVVWKPSPTQALSAEYTMRLLTAAGLPAGVINLVHGAGPEVSSVVLEDPDLAGIHFTGSTATFQHLWQEVGSRITQYRSYPRIVGETGGKDFILAHPSADVDVLRTAMVRGAFEYSGQKCSAASRAYVPRSVWTRLKDGLADVTNSLPVGPVTDFANFTSAVIDERAFAKHAQALERARNAPGVEILAGGKADDSVGYFVDPTVLVVDDPTDEALTTEYFGPILAVHVFDDADFESIAQSIATDSKYALTGAIIAQDRQAVASVMETLRFAAGNFYINDKPTGAVVGQQPFGGARASGTNDKAGAPQNLQRWTSTRSIKETFEPAVDWRYPHMG
ncbi:L-glutamate gamma-semialdehyde dehydrogenase [Kineosporia sp. NBRC 101731]|uniref:L-glutamate gamma-semialdehyde dehydrogenase n=1 Tax=Kineosporia sp. NBRC 101731 TaxID=3032199 RepID=UPI0024A5559F|nr:L-glutamate gamma-semialdehyde dehydrogenase [Kineosporia sp. NBRC 101731]GLY27575.1 1-pyrroline-5-carboxylate dehydrogenase [Kineosporia sp. NBRC 101731]